MADRQDGVAACKHGYKVREDDPSVQACIDREASAAFRYRWWTNLGEDGFLAYWRSISWLCRLGLHRWKYESVNVAPEVVTDSTGGYDRCQGCDRTKDVWGYV